MRNNKVSDSTPQVANDPRWARIVARDRAADGSFWYSVTTTGVYCRPSCPSRRANPRNVRLHDSLQDARKTGCRACKRCKPDGPAPEADKAAMVAKACQLIAENEPVPTLLELANHVGLSPAYFHRLFKAMTGLTPKEYATAQRAERVRRRLSTGRSVTAAIYDAGFNSSGRFYEQANDMLGMAPSKYRNGGIGEEMKFAIGQSSLGAILVASSAKGVACILIGDDPAKLLRDLQDRFPQAYLLGGDEGYEAVVAKVVGFVEAPGIGLHLPLDIRGSVFQQRVWQALREIPAGRTVSYAGVARAIGAPKAIRAVAGACASECHRCRDPLPSRRPNRWLAFRLSLGPRAQAHAHSTGGDAAMNIEIQEVRNAAT